VQTVRGRTAREKRLKEEIGIPIHFHTHDTAGIQAASLLKAADQGVDVIDAAMATILIESIQAKVGEPAD
jgi:pyruvate carboxylase